jgi:hypothetical protein
MFSALAGAAENKNRRRRGQIYGGFVTPENEIENHRQEVIRRIRAAVEAGASDFTSILARCEGADPILVKELYDTRLPASQPYCDGAADFFCG